MKRLLIANRAEIACRVIRTAHEMGIETVAVYSDVDASALHVQQASTSYALGGNTPAESYLHIEKIIQAALATRSDAIHPGYGFLSENPDFAQAVIDAGLIWVGPSPASIRLLGNKAAAKRLAQQAGVPCLPGYDGLDEYGLVSEYSQSNAVMQEHADKIGYPLMVKAMNGGGGRGMRKVDKSADLLSALESARQEAKNAFNDSSVLLERALLAPRHIEVQIFGDQHGQVVHLGERDCSVQRRHQKIIEESPSPVLDAALREQICLSAVNLAKAAQYYGAGTVEFLLELHPANLSSVNEAAADDDDKLEEFFEAPLNHRFYLMEMNTRLQVEHPVTELRYGLDLVQWQLQVAMGKKLNTHQNQLKPQGHAIELRLCAEDHLFFPQTGRLNCFALPSNSVRIDHALQDALEISPFYDSMMGKWIVWGQNREQAIQKANWALNNSQLFGIQTNQDILQAILTDQDFINGQAHIHWLTDQLSKLHQKLQLNQNHSVHLGLLACTLFWHQAWLHARSNANFDLNASHSSSFHQHLCAPFARPLVFQNSEQLHHFSVLCRKQNSKLILQLSHANENFEFELMYACFDQKIKQLQLLHQGQSYTVKYSEDNEHSLWIQTPWGNSSIQDRSFSAVKRQEASQQASSLRSPMNGKVLQITVKVGDTVEKGQCLVVLESMKLEQQIVASGSAIVAEILIQAGQQAKSGQVLLQLSPMAGN